METKVDKLYSSCGQLCSNRCPHKNMNLQKFCAAQHIEIKKFTILRVVVKPCSNIFPENRFRVSANSGSLTAVKI